MLISGRDGMRLINRTWGRTGRPRSARPIRCGRIAVQYIHNYAGALWTGVAGDSITFVSGRATDLRRSKLPKSSPSMSKISRPAHHPTTTVDDHRLRQSPDRSWSMISQGAHGGTTEQGADLAESRQNPRARLGNCPAPDATRPDSAFPPGTCWPVRTAKQNNWHVRPVGPPRRAGRRAPRCASRRDDIHFRSAGQAAATPSPRIQVSTSRARPNHHVARIRKRKNADSVCSSSDTAALRRSRLGRPTRYRPIG